MKRYYKRIWQDKYVIIQRIEEVSEMYLVLFSHNDVWSAGESGMFFYPELIPISEEEALLEIL